MRIAYMTTHNQICGISDYTASLIKHIPKEHEVKIVAPILNGAHHSLNPVGEDLPNTHRLWHAAIWDGITDIDMVPIEEIAQWADVFHIQFQDALYHHEWLPILVERLSNKTKLVITLHDTCLGKIWPLLPFFKAILTMKPEVQRQVPQAHLLPMPIYNNPPVLKGFGLGRSKHDNIQKVCNELGYIYEYKRAEREWLGIDELIQWLRDSDGIVLYYDEVSTAGTSAAARTALSTRRPLFINNVTWFNDIPEGVAYRFDDDESLKQLLYNTLHRQYNTDSSIQSNVAKHIELYSQI